jgi:hypothetical protein
VASFAKTIRAAVKKLGFAEFWRLANIDLLNHPLEAPDYMERSRSWLLPILTEDLEVGDGLTFSQQIFPVI